MISMENSDYTDYSMERLKDCVTDTLQTEASGDEIADAIITCLQDEVNYHMEAMNKASTVLARLKGNRQKSVSFAKGRDWTDFWNSQPGPNENIVTFS